MSQWKPVGLLVLVVGVAASGCAGSLRELRQVASREHSCPVDKIETVLHEGYVAMLDVCGTHRRYLYQAFHAAGELCPPHSWQEVGMEINAFEPQQRKNTWLYDMWGTSASNIWAVGTRGALFHFDGKAWESLPCEGRPIDHFGVWGAQANAVWVVGSEGKVLRWDGKVWTREQLPTSTTLIGVHGTSRDDLWIVGRKGLIVHWDGAEWKPVESGAKRDLYRVWAVRPDLAWAVGDVGTLLRWDGHRWAKDDLRTVSPLMTIWASSAKDVWVGALSGQVLRWNGRRWDSVEVFSVEDMKEREPCVEKIFGFSRDDVWVLGSQIHHHDARGWRRLDWDPVANRKLAGSGTSSWGTSSMNVYAATVWEYDFRHLNGSGAIERNYDRWDGRSWRQGSWPVNRCK